MRKRGRVDCKYDEEFELGAVTYTNNAWLTLSFQAIVNIEKKMLFHSSSIVECGAHEGIFINVAYLGLLTLDICY